MPVPRPSYPMIAARQLDVLARESGIPDDLVPGVSKLFRRVLDKQAIDERLNYQWIDSNIGGGGSGPYPATKVVASSTASAAAKAGADFVCDGVADDVEINNALDAVGSGGGVLLSEGFFTLSDGIFTNLDVSLFGQLGNIHTTNLETSVGYPTATPMVTMATHSGLRYVTFKPVDPNILYARTNGLETVISDCYFFDGAGLDINSAGHLISFNWLECDQNYPGMNLSSATNIKVLFNYVLGRGLGGTIGTGAGIEVFPGTVQKGLIVEGNKVQGFKGHGIHARNIAEARIVGNYVLECSQAANNTYDGIHLESAVDDSLVTDNIVKIGGSINQQRYGINNASATNDRNLIRDNHLYQSGVTGSFNDAGTATNVVDANGNYV